MSFPTDNESRHMPQIYPDWDAILNETIRQEIINRTPKQRVSPIKLLPSQSPSPTSPPVLQSTSATISTDPIPSASTSPTHGQVQVEKDEEKVDDTIKFAVLPNGKFDNEFQDKLREQVQTLLTHHVKSEQIDCTDRSMYTGLPGISLLYHHLSTITSFSSKMREELASKATHHVNQYLTSIQSQHMHNSKCPSYLCGDLGVYTLTAIVRNQQRLHREALVRTLSDPGSVMPGTPVMIPANSAIAHAHSSLSTTSTSQQTNPPTDTPASTTPTNCENAGLESTTAGQAASANCSLMANHTASNANVNSTTTNFNIIEHICNEPETSLLLDKIMELIKMQEAPGTPDELLYGRTGGLYAMMLIKQQLPKQTVVKDEHIIAQIALILKSGQTMESFGRPLFYAWHGKEYVGAAHGYAGILYMLLEAHNYLTQDQLKLVRDAVNFVEGTKYPSNNYPSSIGSQTDRLVHWCHGAPGVVHMLAKAYQVYKDEQYLQSALACGDVIWQRGLLKKGFSLCHGISGNGYAFLRLYQLTKDLKHLYRAGKFAQYYMEQRHTINWRADSPASLFEGFAGLAFYLADLLNPDGARFPAFQLTA